MARPPKWNGKTTAIRVPEHCAAQLLALAKQLDQQQSEDFVQNDIGPYLVAIETHKDGIQRFMIRPDADTPPEVWAEADRLIDELCAGLDANERMWLLAELTRAWGDKV